MDMHVVEECGHRYAGAATGRKLMPTVEDAAESAGAANASAFNALVHRHQDVAYHVAYRVLRHPDAAADATQDALLSAHRALPAFRGTSMRAWLLRIVTYACYDQLRSERRRPQAALASVVEDPDYAAELTDLAETPEEALLRQDLLQSMQAAIARLPLDQRVVLVLADVQGLSYEEISATTGASLGTVRSRLSRARARVRECLT